jgi:O-Antigen ligase
MTSPATILRPRRRILSAAPRLTVERLTRHRVYLAWSLLFFNALTFYPGYSFIHIPSTLGKGIAQSALPFALVTVVSLNRRLILRPNVFLCLVTLIVLAAFMTCLQPEHVGTVIRTFRLAGFVVGLWLLTPWWGRRDLLLVRCHLAVLSVLLSSVVLGLMISPHTARNSAGTGRLGGALWPMPPTQVAHYAAVTTGLVVVLWFCGKLRGRTAAIAAIASLVILVLTHTRTALVALIAGVLLAGLSLIIAKPRVRKLFAIAGAVAAVAVVTLSAFLTTWLERGQSSQGLANLTGRTEVWGPLLAAPRDKFQVIFGFGLSSSSFNGLPIDSNWFASYNMLGLFGVVVCATMLLFLLVSAYFQPRGLQRALALFLVTYCLVASFTEVGFTDVSPYLLDLTVAASLLVPSWEGSFRVPPWKWSLPGSPGDPPVPTGERSLPVPSEEGNAPA